MKLLGMQVQVKVGTFYIWHLFYVLLSHNFLKLYIYATMGG